MSLYQESVAVSEISERILIQDNLNKIERTKNARGSVATTMVTYQMDFIGPILPPEPVYPSGYTSPREDRLKSHKSYLGSVERYKAKSRDRDIQEQRNNLPWSW